MIVEFEKANEKTWNSALSDAEPKGTIFQSTYWAEYLKKTFGDHPIYIAFLDKKGSIEGLLLAIESCYAKYSILTLCGKRGLLFSKLYKHAISPLFHKMSPFIFWENGPVILSQSSEEKTRHKAVLYRKMVEKIVDGAQERNCYEIKFARPAFFDDNSEVFSSLGFQNRRMGTILVNLDQSLEVLWKQVEKDARRTVRRGVEQGVEVTKASKFEELREFYDLNVQSSKRAKTKVYPFSHFASLWSHFSPLDKTVVFVAHVKDKPVAAALYLMHNETIHIFALGDSHYARSNRIYGNEVLMWQVIKWAHERGFKYFDHSGVELYKVDAGDEKARNIFRFKLKWGGQLVEYHDYKSHLQEKKLVKSLNRFLADPVIHN